MLRPSTFGNYRQNFDKYLSKIVISSPGIGNELRVSTPLLHIAYIAPLL